MVFFKKIDIEFLEDKSFSNLAGKFSLSWGTHKIIFNQDRYLMKICLQNPDWPDLAKN